MLKDVERDRVIDAVRAVAGGEQLVGASVLHRLLDRYARGRRSRAARARRRSRASPNAIALERHGAADRELYVSR